MLSYTPYLLLFTTFFKAALFVVGGGLAIVPLIEEVFVKKHRLMNDQDMLDMVTMTQTVPGLIAVNAALFTGYRLGKAKGALAAVLGLIIPSIVILSLIAAFFGMLSVQTPAAKAAFSCVRAAVAGIFITTAVRLGRGVLKSWADILIAAAFVGALFFMPPTALIVAALPVGWGYMAFKKRNREPRA